jgi:electron transport complex protein RnfB
VSTPNLQIDALLPQTQCQRCGYPRCADYADAIAAGEANINRCPPGSEYTRTALAQLLHREAVELDPECGSESPRLLFYINEKNCIGCTLCIQACPVDAIVGSAKKMHTIIAGECTGCELCVPACPVDCIHSETHPAADTTPSGKWPGISDVEAERARRRINSRLQRLQRIAKAESEKRKSREASNIQDEIAAAVVRVKQKQIRK